MLDVKFIWQYIRDIFNYILAGPAWEKNPFFKMNLIQLLSDFVEDAIET